MLRVVVEVNREGRLHCSAATFGLSELRIMCVFICLGVARLPASAHGRDSHQILSLVYYKIAVFNTISNGI